MYVFMIAEIICIGIGNNVYVNLEMKWEINLIYFSVEILSIKTQIQKEWTGLMKKILILVFRFISFF